MIRKGSRTWDTGNSGSDPDGSDEAGSRPLGLKGAPTEGSRDLPVVAIVGRPNVGKSTLFNRLVGVRKAIVEDTPGVTRDTNMGEAEWGPARFLVMDTGGLESVVPSEGVSDKVRVQIEKAVDMADVLLFVVDGKVSVHPQDLDVARILRKKEKPILCAVNKIDTHSHLENLYPYYRFGLEPLIPISAEHGIGLNELLDAVVDRLPSPEEGSREVPTGEPIRVAVLGRPNVGKSTLVNSLLGEERQVVDEKPGTTRDAIDTPFTWRGTPFLLIDTAGIRKKAKVTAVLEKIAVIKALQSLERCDVALLMLDAGEGIGDQDAQIGRTILEKGKGVVILMNKWDLLKGRGKSSRKVLDGVRDQLPHLRFAPVVPISALTGYNVVNALRWIQRVERSSRMRVPTGPLNRLLEDAVKAHSPPSDGTRLRKLNYITQVKEAPPTFLIFGNTSRKVEASYQRYLMNRIRDRFGFKGVPLRLVFKKKG
jgi:GTP-binding protein